MANGTQPYSWLSLGTYPSISQIKNGVKNSIFNDVIIKDVKEKTTIYRLIVLKNTTANPVTNIYIEKITGCICNFKGALVQPALDICNESIFESILDETDIPISATFTDIEGAGNALVISSLAASAVIGVWLKREIDTSNTDYFLNNEFNVNTCDLLYNANNDVNNFYNKKIDGFSIKITY